MRRFCYPGVITAVLVYVPLAITAYAVFLTSGQLTWPQAALSALLGVSIMGGLMVWVLSRQAAQVG